jgi:hypothetical protein
MEGYIRPEWTRLHIRRICHWLDLESCGYGVRSGRKRCSVATSHSQTGFWLIPASGLPTLPNTALSIHKHAVGQLTALRSRHMNCARSCVTMQRNRVCDDSIFRQLSIYRQMQHTTWNKYTTWLIITNVLVGYFGGRVRSTSASYSGYPGFESRGGNRLFWVSHFP